MLYPDSIEQKIGFNTVRLLLKEQCSSSLGTSFVNKMKFSDDAERISKRLYQAEEFRQILTREEYFPSSNYLDATAHLNTAKTPGAFLTEEEFHEIQLSLDTVFRCVRFFDKDTDNRYPQLKALSRYVDLNPVILKKIQAIIDEQGHLRNNASRELQEIRRMILSEQTRLRKVLDQILRHARSQGYTPEDASLTVRGGRMVIPVLAEHKRRVKGFIHDESATGQTVYLEPAEVLDINNEIRDLEYRERREIVRLLIALTDELRPFIKPLRDAYHFLGMMDFIRAKARLAIKFNAVCPALEITPLIEWYQARHPLLEMSLQQQQKKVVPLDIQLHEQQRILLISGPNAGGKSVCLKTVALLQYMLQCGLLIPVADYSRTGIFQNIFIDIGDEQSLENDLSTYSSHLKNMNYFVKFADRKTLILIDEFGTGTEPQFGGAIAEAILEELNSQKSYGVITTHYTNLKQFANQAEGVVNGAMRFDTEHLEPLFRLEIGKPGSSFALEIAKKIGLKPEVLIKAKAYIGEDKVDFDRMLAELEHDRKKYDQLLLELTAKERRMEKTAREYDELKAYLDSQKKQIVNQAKQEAKQLVEEANRAIETTIRTIKEQQAEKKATQEVRKDLEQFKKKLRPQKTARLPRKEKEITQVLSGEIVAGDAVRIKDTGAIGEVITIKNNQAEILIGSLKSNIKTSRLEKIAKKELKRMHTEVAETRPSINLNEKLANFNTNLDLRGKRVEEVIPRLENFVDEAAMFGMPELRIVHGKGDGILRQVVRNYLQNHPQVQRAEDEHVERGGAGVTVITMK